MKHHKFIPFMLMTALLLSACSGAAGAAAPSPSPEAEAASLPLDGADMFTQRDLDEGYDESACVLIRLEGDAISCDSPEVQISGSDAVITGDGSYRLTGTLRDGSITVSAGKDVKPRLILDGASVTNADTAALCVLQAGKVVLTLAPGSQNSLTSGGFDGAETGVDGALFSKEDLSLNGSGSLTVNSPAGHGLVCKDDLVLAGGSLTVAAASHGLDVNDSFRMAAGSLRIEAGKDGVHVENEEDSALGFVYLSGGSLDVTADGDGVSASGPMRIEGGSYTLLTGGGSANSTKERGSGFGDFGGFRGGPGFSNTETVGEDADSDVSSKALKAGGELAISGGSFTIDAADDSIHSNASATVSGGSFSISTGDDGFHADETLAVSGGTIDIAACYEGLEAQNLTVSGGDIRLIATDDGLNAAGGVDGSGFGGPRGGDRFGSRGGPGGMPGGATGGDLSGGDPSQTGAAGSSIVISGGTLNIQASGDGIDSNGTLEISGGTTVVAGPSQGDTATLDYEISGVITGGSFIGTGGAGMAQTFSSSAQGVVSVSVGNQSAGTKITLTDSQGQTLLSAEPALPFAVVILSCPEMIQGESYTLAVGSASKSFTAS